MATYLIKIFKAFSDLLDSSQVLNNVVYLVAGAAVSYLFGILSSNREYKRQRKDIIKEKEAEILSKAVATVNGFKFHVASVQSQFNMLKEKADDESRTICDRVLHEMEEKVRGDILDRLSLSKFSLGRLKNKSYFKLYSQIADEGGLLVTDLAANLVDYRNRATQLMNFSDRINNWNIHCKDFVDTCLNRSKLEG